MASMLIAVVDLEWEAFAAAKERPHPRLVASALCVDAPVPGLWATGLGRGSTAADECFAQSGVADLAIALDTMEDRPLVCRRGRHSPRRLRGKSSR
jgi:hypothetical protein